MSCSSNEQNAGVFQLLTQLCSKTASKYCSHSRLSHKSMVTKMRSYSYEIILKKTTKVLTINEGEPFKDLLTYYFILQKNCKNIAEYKRSLELKKIISMIRKTDFGEQKEDIYKILRLLVGLSNTVIEDSAKEIYQVGLHTYSTYIEYILCYLDIIFSDLIR